MFFRNTQEDYDGFNKLIREGHSYVSETLI